MSATEPNKLITMVTGNEYFFFESGISIRLWMKYHIKNTYYPLTLSTKLIFCLVSWSISLVSPFKFRWLFVTFIFIFPVIL